MIKIDPPMIIYITKLNKNTPVAASTLDTARRLRHRTHPDEIYHTRRSKTTNIMLLW